MFYRVLRVLQSTTITNFLSTPNLRTTNKNIPARSATDLVLSMSLVELNERFALPNNELQPDVAGELQSIMRLHSLSEQELFFKWEAYSIKMGGENVRMDYKTARDFKKDLQDNLERESRGKAHTQSASKRGVTATPRASNNGDVFGV